MVFWHKPAVLAFRLLTMAGRIRIMSLCNETFPSLVSDKKSLLDKRSVCTFCAWESISLFDKGKTALP